MIKNLGMTFALTSSLAQATPVFNLFELGIQDQVQYDTVGKHSSITDEVGALAMYSVKQSNHPQMVYMVEIYADEQAYQLHLTSPQYQAFIEQSPRILTKHKKQIELVPPFLGDKKIAQTAQMRSHLVIVEVKPEWN